MDQVIQPYVANHQFMGSVLVARNGQVIYSKGFGSADLEWDVPNSPGTKFRLGSVTKQFTAASILLLEERGKLSVSDPVKKYLPDAPAAWDKITIFHLLTHTSGIPNFTGFRGLPEARTIRRDVGATGGAFPRQAARFRAWREVAIQQFRICTARLPDRKDHGRKLREVRSGEYLYTPGHEGFRLRFQFRGDSAQGLRIRAWQERLRERRLHPYEHSPWCGRPLFDDRGLVEVGAGSLRRETAEAGIAPKDDHAVQDRTMPSGCRWRPPADTR